MPTPTQNDRANRPITGARAAIRRPIVRAYLAGLVAVTGCGVTEYKDAPPQPSQPANTVSGSSSGSGAVSGSSSGSGAVSGSSGSQPAPTSTAAPSGSSGGSGSMPVATTDSGAGAPSQGGGSGAVASDGGAAAPLSGITVNINGVTVPKEKVVAFIHFGHSNMAGRGDVPLPLRPWFFTNADPHGWIFSANGAFTPCLEPNTAGDGTNNMGAPGQVTPLGGPGTALIKQAIAMAPDYYFVSLGFGQSSAYCSEFLPGHLYYDSLIAAAKAIKGKVTFGAIVVMLGITERHGTAADITGYPNCINSLVTQVRTDVGEPNLPLLLTDYEMTATGMLAPTQPFALSIIPQIHMVPTVVSNSALVPTDGLVLVDDHHFNLQSHQIWTQRALDIMKANGWFPWN